jgi:hypothetical protein
VPKDEYCACTSSVRAPRVDADERPEREHRRERVHEHSAGANEAELASEWFVDQVGRLAGEKAECEESS